MSSTKIKVKKEKKLKSKVVKNKKKAPVNIIIKAKPKSNIESKSIIQEKIENIAKNVKYIMPTKSVTDELVNSCLSALQELAVHQNKKKTLLEDETLIFAEIRCIKIQSLPGNIKFVLPHSTAASTGEICLVTPDLKKGKKVDHEPTIEHWEEKLRKAGVTNVKTILPLRQIRVEYDQFELKRRLLTQHDFIMVDTRILNQTSHVLGKMFFKRHNMLIPVRINETDIKKSIEKGLRTVMLRLSEGETSTIVVGHTGMVQNEVKENVISLINQLQTKYPGGEANIRSISLKLPLSLSLPLYITLRPSNTISAPKLRQKKPKNFTVLEDELSTIPGSRVKVAPDGTVHLIKVKKTDSDTPEDSENEETNSKLSDQENDKE